jgi:hypothetical protein
MEDIVGFTGSLIVKDPVMSVSPPIVAVPEISHVLSQIKLLSI